MGGVFIDPNPIHKKDYIDPNTGNKIVGDTGNGIDRTVIEIAAHNKVVTAPANLNEILAIKEKRLKEIPDEELSGFDVTNLGSVGETIKTGGIINGLTKPNPLQSVIEQKVNQAVVNAIGKIDIGKMVEKAVNDAFGGIK